MNATLLSAAGALLLGVPLPDESAVQSGDLTLFNGQNDEVRQIDRTHYLWKCVTYWGSVPRTVRTADDRERLADELWRTMGAWILLRRAREETGADRLRYLKQLRDNLGPDAYRHGKMPPAVPSRWYPEGYSFPCEEP